MACVNCRNEVFYARLCRRCFTKVIEKRVARWLKQQQLVQPRDNIALPRGSSVEAVAAAAVFRSIATFPYTEDERGKHIIPWSLERELEERLQKLLRRKAGEETGIKLLQNVTVDEQKAYCEAKNLGFEERKEEASDESELLRQLCGDDSSLKFGLLKSSKTFIKS